MTWRRPVNGESEAASHGDEARQDPELDQGPSPARPAMRGPKATGWNAERPDPDRLNARPALTHALDA